MTGEREFYVYLHCRPDGSPFYVGKGTAKRVTNFSQRTAHHKNVVAKYGKENIGVFAFACDSEEQALADEVAHIGQLRADGCALVNLTAGGDGIAGYVHTELARERIGAAGRGNQYAKGAKHSAETKARMTAQRIGKTLPAQTRAKIGASHRHRNAATAWQRHEKKLLARLSRIDDKLTKIADGWKRPCTYKMTDAHREVLRRCNLGKKQSPETLAKLSVIRTGRKASPETLAKLSAAQRARTDKYVPTKETIEKIAASRRGKKQGPHSPEHRAALSAAHMGKKGHIPNEETRQRMSEAQRGRKMPPGALQKAWETRRAKALKES